MKIVRLLSALVLGGTIVSSAHAITITEDFSAGGPGGDPFARGWSVEGDADLFVWDSAAGNLQVTWDSTKPNSFFHQPLGMVVNKSHDFSVGFDIKLSDIASHPEKPGAMQVAVGFINLNQATNINYRRATGFESPNLAEFNYFHDTGFGESVSPLMISTNHQFAGNFSQYAFKLELNTQYRIEMNYTASNTTLHTIVNYNGANVFEVPVVLSPSFTDVALDTIAISSYSDAGQDPMWAGSILAHGVIDNIVVNTPAPAVGSISLIKFHGLLRANVFCQPGETYVLQRTTDFQNWEGVATNAAYRTTLSLQDENVLPGHAFYRVMQVP